MTILTQGSEATTTRGLSVEFEDIHQRSIHGDRPVRALNLNLSTGSSEFVSIVGPSGCGKTTALSMTVGLAGRGPGRAAGRAGGHLLGSGRVVADIRIDLERPRRQEMRISSEVFHGYYHQLADLLKDTVRATEDERSN